MNMQFNFTTPEQSKRLLELGVPANSADCFYDEDDIECGANYVFPIPEWKTFDDYTKDLDIIPCFSLGRLIEISIICGLGERVPNELYINSYSFVPSLIENIISRLEKVADLSINDIDFSKLED